MSASSADKLQDHYQVLGIDPESVSETIHRAYGTLAQKYHPRSSATGNAEMFDAVNLAYEVLSDPIRRREFDALKGVGQEAGGPKFNGVEFFNALGRETVLRSAILCLLYDRRRKRPSTPSLSMRHIETMVEATAIELSSALWYLKQRALVVSDDKSSLQITADGMDFLVSNRPVPEEVMAFIKPEVLVISHAASPRSQMKSLPTRVPDPESALRTLHHELARTSD